MISTNDSPSLLLHQVLPSVQHFAASGTVSTHCVSEWRSSVGSPIQQDGGMFMARKYKWNSNMLQYVQALNWRRCADDALQHERKKTFKNRTRRKLATNFWRFLWSHAGLFSFFAGNLLCNSPFDSFYLYRARQICTGREHRRSPSLYVLTLLRAIGLKRFCLEADRFSLPVLASSHWSHHSTNVHCSSCCHRFRSPVNSKLTHWLFLIVFPCPAVTKPFCRLINCSAQQTKTKDFSLLFTKFLWIFSRSLKVLSPPRCFKGNWAERIFSECIFAARFSSWYLVLS